MTDLTAGKAKCLLPVGGLPLLWSVASFCQWSQDDIYGKDFDDPVLQVPAAHVAMQRLH